MHLETKYDIIFDNVSIFVVFQYQTQYLLQNFVPAGQQGMVGIGQNNPMALGASAVKFLLGRDFYHGILPGAEHQDGGTDGFGHSISQKPLFQP